MPEANRLSRMISTAAVVVLFFAAFTAVASATDYYVRTGGLDDPGHDGLANDDAHAWKTISYAIGRDEVTAGDTIHMAAGEYSENVDVDKSITLEGEGADVVTVRAADTRDHVFEVTAGYVNISRFTVTEATGDAKAGIYLGNGVNHCNISNNIASGNKYGIYLDCSSSNNLTNNIASNKNWYGIRLKFSNNNTLMSNTISDNGWSGICIDHSNNNNLTDNTASNNDDHGICIDHSSNNSLTNNTISGSDHGIYLKSSSNNTLTDNTASNGGGICLTSSSNNKITDNTASNNGGDGICLSSSSNNTLAGNTASDNGGDGGICLYFSSNNSVTDNTASNNGGGIYLSYSSKNHLSDNMITGNRCNFGVYGDCPSHFIHNIDASNLVNEKPVYYWVDQHDRQVPYDAGFVGIVNSTNITVRDLTLTNNRIGILFICTNDSRIENVTVSKNDYHGIYMWRSNNNTLTANIASDNGDHYYDYGVYLYYSSNNNLTGNTASDNYGGILLYYSGDNTLIDNTAANNDRGIYIYHSSNNTLTSNTVSGNDCGISLDSSRGNDLTGNNASNNDHHGISLSPSSNNNNLTSNIASNNSDRGIYISSSNNTLTDNIASNNDDRGIYLSSSNNNDLISNTASNNKDYGIYLESSSNNNLIGNIMSGNKYDFGVYGDSFPNFIQNMDASNLVNEKPVYYWVDQQDRQVPDNAGFVGVVNSTNITVRDLTVTNTDTGVLFAYTNNSRIENVTASNNDCHGIYP